MADLRGDMVESNALASKLGIWTFELVEERLVEALRMWRRTPGQPGPSSTSPYASDIPAELIVKDAWEYDARGGDLRSDKEAVPLPPLSRSQMAERDQVSEWLVYVPDTDRKLVIMVLGIKAADRRPEWLQIKRRMGIERGADGLRMRYNRAITSVCNRLNQRSAHNG